MQVSKLEFSLKTRNSFGLPDFKGSTFRGKFGHILKRTICINTEKDCAKCNLREKCAYIYLFETHNGHNQEVARPFIIEPPLTRKQFFLKDEMLYFNLVLVGKAQEYLPYFVYTFHKMGEEGIGRDRGRFSLEEVRAVDERGERVSIYNHSEKTLHNHFPRIDLEKIEAELRPSVTLHFLTPAKITVNKKLVDELTFPVLLKSILRRYHSLRYFHQDGSKERFEIDWEAAERIRILNNNLKCRRLKRYSNRQKRPLPLEGFVGKITYEGNLSPFMPWIKIGEYLHVGKGTTFGLGWYRVV